MKRFKSTILAALAVVIAGAYALPALPVAAQSSAALSITPKKNYTIEAGKSIKDKLTIRNLDNDKTLDLTLRVVDFTFNDDGGTPKLMLAEDAPQTTWSLRSFVTIPKSVKVAPGQSKTVDMNIAIPAGHGAGSYYSAVVYSSGAPDGGNVGLNASGVSLVFAQIPGKVKEDLKVEKFGAYNQSSADKKPDYTFVTMNEPQSMAYTLKNNGNVTESPVGTITIKGLFGDTKTISEVNPNSSLALIGQSRTFVSCIQLKEQEVDFNGEKSNTRVCETPGLWPGYYSANLNLFYGQNGNMTKELVSNASFWYLPLWFLIIVLALVAVIAFFIWRLVRKIRGNTGRGRPKKSFRRK